MGLSLSFFIVLVGSWNVSIAEDSELLVATPLNPKSSSGSTTLFEAIPGQSIGVEMSYLLDSKHEMKRLYPFGWATGNCAIGDVNLDGKLDLFFPGTTSSHKLFVQENDFRFRDVSVAAGIPQAPDTWGSSAVMGDIDRDGDLDIYVVNFASPNQLFVNFSRGGRIQFAEMGKDYGVALSGGCLGASFVDYNGDGWLDLFVQTYHYEPEKGRPSKIKIKNEDGVARLDPEWEVSYLAYFDKEKKPKWTEAGLTDVLLINDRKGKFLVPNAGIAPGRSYGVSHLWWDVDNDQRPDLYTGYDSHGPDVFYRQSGRNTFQVLGLGSIPCSPWFSRGATAADFNNDLQIDFFGTGHSPLTALDRLKYGEPFPSDVYRSLSSSGTRQVARNVMLANTGTSRFEEIARMAGVAYSGATWAVTSGDYDCDGRIDLFMANGEARDWTSLPGSELVGEKLKGKTRWDILLKQPEKRQRDMAFQNLGDWKFKETGRQWGLDHLGMSYCVSQGDLDGDGDLDLVVNRLGENVTIYQNHSQEPRVVFAFEGERSNTSGIGVEMLAIVGNAGQMQQLYPSGGFKAGHEMAMHLGLGTSNKVRRVTFRWPGSGTVGTFPDLKAGYRYVVKEGGTTHTRVAIIRRAPLFRSDRSLAGLGQGEEPFAASQVQPMLPESLAYSGPGMALSDLDADGLSEMYISGSANRSGQLVARSAAMMRFPQPFAEAKESEETVPLFFDANGDGTLDLFVGSGGIQYAKNESVLGDKLYVNLGKGRFAPAPRGSLPPLREITSAAAAADFDRDGDLDLFVGSRMKKGGYPMSGRNVILLNQGKARFEDKTDQVADGLTGSGMVTGAIWSDANNDGWIDLLLTHDWGTPQIWINQKGILSNNTTTAGLGNLTGRWNGITGRDIDNDGDIDYLLANIGTNSDAPDRVFSKLFPDSKAPAVVEMREIKGGILPSRNWSEWASLPSVRKTIKSPAQFAAEAETLFGISTPSRSVVRVTEKRTGLLINDGNANFTFVPLPTAAQISPVYGMALTDFNFDGRCDAFVLQNEMSATLRNPDPGNNGISRVFIGTGKPRKPFVSLSPAESGLVIFGNGRGVVVTDLNADSRADLVCSINQSDPAPFFNFEPKGRFQPLKVQLDFTGKPVPGAFVTVQIPGFPAQTAEYYAGGGYLSQSSSDLFFGAPANPSGPARIKIRWSDGSETMRTYYFDSE